MGGDVDVGGRIVVKSVDVFATGKAVDIGGRIVVKSVDVFATGKAVDIGGRIVVKSVDVFAIGQATNRKLTLQYLLVLDVKSLLVIFAITVWVILRDPSGSRTDPTPMQATR